MLTLVEALHGYAVMQKVEETSKGTVKIGPGTLYGVFVSLEKEGLIVKVKKENRRKSYVLTPKGKKVLMNQIKREHLGQMSAWHYFRREAQEGEALKIYTDVESKVARYEKVLTYSAFLL